MHDNSLNSLRLAVARWLYTSRGDRPAGEIDDLFGEPAWDVLLDLYIAHCCGKRTAVSSACLAARVPPTTALRYIKSLCEKGMAERFPDERDRRRLWLQLSPRAIRAMDEYIDRLALELRELFGRGAEMPAPQLRDFRGGGSAKTSNVA